MFYFYSSFITCLGISLLLLYFFSVRLKARDTTFLLGFYFLCSLGILTTLLTLSNTLLGVPLSLGSKSLFIISLFGFLTFFSRKMRSTLREEWAYFCFHPCILLLALLVFSQYLPDNPFSFGYSPRMWDEYPIWLLYPQQFIHFDKLSSTNFLFQSHITYTPGWSLLIAYPFLAFKEAFSFYPTLFTAYLVKLIFFGTVFDSIYTFFRKKLSIENHRILLVYFLIFLMFSMRFFPYFLVSNLLIESPQYLIGGSLLLLINYTLQQKVIRKDLIFLSGILLNLLFLIKKPTALIVPLFLIFLVFHFFRNLRTEEEVSQKVRKAFSILTIGLSPFAFTFIAWKLETAGYDDIYPLFKIQFGIHKSVSGLISNMWSAIPGTLLRTLDSFQRISFFAKACLIFLTTGLLHKKYRKVSTLGLMWILINLAGLFWIYIATKGLIDPKKFFDLGRYMTVPLYSSATVGYIIFIDFIFSQIINLNKRFDHPKVNQFLKYRSLTTVLILLLFIPIIFKFSRNIPEVVYDHKVRNDHSLHTIIRQSYEIGEFLSKLPEDQRKVVMFGEGDDENLIRYYHYSYAGIIRQGRINFFPAYHRLKEFPLQEDLDKYIKKVAGIWSFTFSDALAKRLSKYMDKKTCKKPLNNYFLIRKELTPNTTPLFECFEINNKL